MWDIGVLNRLPLGVFICIAVYFFILVFLCIFGFHKIWLVFLYYRNRNKIPVPKGYFDKNNLPYVTIQLPIYNELFVVSRLIDAVSNIDYPRDKLEIQVLDDSTDESTEMIKEKVAQKQSEGFLIYHIRRGNRDGFKAGALVYGLKFAKGDFIAIFDADFLPDRDILNNTIHFFTDPKVGLVQTRWEHANRDFSLFTQSQAVMLDGHFIIEHTARNCSGRFINFNGTAGIWRRKTIEDAGGWGTDTWTEDLDLSYRAQLKGWKFVYLRNVVTPGELPIEMNSFKEQQYRWTKGAIQTAKKLFKPVISARIPFAIKIEAILHLMTNFSYPFVFVLSLLMLPVIIFRHIYGIPSFIILEAILFLGAFVSICVFFAVSQKEICDGKKCQKLLLNLLRIPLLFTLGIGICIYNTKAIMEAIFNQKSEFTRTPKYNITQSNLQDKVGCPGNTKDKRYVLPPNFIVIFLELLMGIYFLATVYYSLQYKFYYILPFELLFVIGFFWVSLSSLRGVKIITR